jgi:hypothetical protein
MIKGCRDFVSDDISANQKKRKSNTKEQREKKTKTEEHFKQ